MRPDMWSTDGIILVHGGLHSSACWSAFLPFLELPTRAVDLPGRGNRPADLGTVTLDDCVDAVLDEAVTAGFGRFALVGHSLGGVTITETGYRHPGRVSHLVYVGALVPPPGSNAARVMTGDDLRTSDGILPPMDQSMARALFGNDLTDEQWAEAAAGLVPDAAALMNARLSGYPTGVPVTYVNMSDDVPVPPPLAEQMASNLGGAVERHTIDAGHSVMVSKPAELAAIINAAVAK
jgi:pimeloyl-ACP methyl ester carboxylesterase